ncbi:restriction endonuclease subunit S [Parasphingorhabdus sp. JC815]|uniref:restriction endonuclease subunit S n=1 Tax=Parasphingorhabdus sp. JC815 TaxID=3232140 RepID=UPI003457672B
MMPIKHAARFLNGAAFKPSDWGDTGLPILRIAQLTGKPFDNYFDGTINRGLLIRDGDLLFSWSATIDAFIWNRGDAILNQHIFKVLPKTNAVKKYLYYVIKAHAPRWADDDAHGSTMRHIKKESLSNKVWIPELEAQNQIVEFLDGEVSKIDELIDKKKRQVELLREKQKSFSVEEVTGSNISEKSGTGLGQLPFAPSHWRVKRVAAVFRESFEMGGEELPVLSVSINWGISDRELEDEDRHRIVTHIEDRNAYKRVRVGDLVYNMMRAWQGGFGVAKVDGLVSPAYVVARPSEEIHAPFFEHLLRTPMWIEEFRRSSKGIADFRQRLYWEHFRQVGLVLPPLEEQVEIANRIAANDAAIEAVLTPIQVSIERLAELRSALITSAVTGQINVETWGKEGNTDRRLDQIEEDMALREARA